MVYFVVQNEIFCSNCSEIWLQRTIVFACPPAWVKDVRLRPAQSCTHLIAAKVAPWCFTEQSVSLAVPVSISHSCQADLRWQNEEGKRPAAAARPVWIFVLRFCLEQQRFCFRVGSSAGNKPGRSLNQQLGEVENLNVFLLRCFAL